MTRPGSAPGDGTAPGNGGPAAGGGEAAALYAYCLLAADGEPPLEGLPRGLPGLGAPRLVAVAEGLHLVAADAPLPAYSGAEIEARLGELAWVSDRALAHERVVEHFLALGAACTVVPLKLFTLFADEASAVERLASRRGEIEALVGRLAGRVEWGVRVLFDPQAAHRRGGEATTEAQAAGSGRGYLQAKKRSREAVRDAAATAAEEAGRLHRELAAVAADAHRREPGPETPSLVLDAAYLVDLDRRSELDDALAAGAARLADASCDTVVSGPWPAYHFAGDVG